MNLMAKMAESVENKGFYRTQSKIAAELIIEHQLMLFVIMHLFVGEIVVIHHAIKILF